MRCTCTRCNRKRKVVLPTPIAPKKSKSKTSRTKNSDSNNTDDESEDEGNKAKSTLGNKYNKPPRKMDARLDNKGDDNGIPKTKTIDLTRSAGKFSTLKSYILDCTPNEHLFIFISRYAWVLISRCKSGLIIPWIGLTADLFYKSNIVRYSYYKLSFKARRLYTVR